MTRLIWSAAALASLPALAQAEPITITEREVWRNAIEVVEAKCGAEWRAVKETPLPIEERDALRFRLETASVEAFVIPYPHTMQDLQLRAYVVIMADDVGLLPSFLKVAKDT